MHYVAAGSGISDGSRKILMDLETGRKIIDESVLLDSLIANIAKTIDESLIESELVNFRRGVADVAGAVYVNLIFPIVAIYPELDPDIK